MKLIFCPTCEDVLKLRISPAPRRCHCGDSWGRYYADGIRAEIGGRAVPLGFANNSFAEALRNRPADGKGELFTAFVMPVAVPTIKAA